MIQKGAMISLTESVDTLAAPHKGHFKPPASSCCRTIVSLTHCLQQGSETASFKKVLLIGHFKYSGTSFMSMFSVAEDSLCMCVCCPGHNKQ